MWLKSGGNCFSRALLQSVHSWLANPSSTFVTAHLVPFNSGTLHAVRQRAERDFTRLRIIPSAALNSTEVGPPNHQTLFDPQPSWCKKNANRFSKTVRSQCHLGDVFLQWRINLVEKCFCAVSREEKWNGGEQANPMHDLQKIRNSTEHWGFCTYGMHGHRKVIANAIAE